MRLLLTTAAVALMGVTAAQAAPVFHPEARGYLSDWAERAEDRLGGEFAQSQINVGLGEFGSVDVDAGSNLLVAPDTEFGRADGQRRGRSPGFGSISRSRLSADGSMDRNGYDGIRGVNEELNLTFTQTLDVIFDVSETRADWRETDGIDHTAYTGSVLGARNGERGSFDVVDGLLAVSGVDTFSFFGNGPDAYDIYVDVASIEAPAPVPVPASVALLGGGLMGLGALGAYRRRQTA